MTEKVNPRVFSCCLIEHCHRHICEKNTYQSVHVDTGRSDRGDEYFFYTFENLIISLSFTQSLTSRSSSNVIKY